MLCGWAGGECMPVLFKKDFMMYCIACGGGGVYASAFNEDFMLYCIVKIQIQNNFIDTVHIINTYWVISSIKFNR